MGRHRDDSGTARGGRLLRTGAAVVTGAALVAACGVLSGAEETADDVVCGWHRDAAVGPVRSYADLLPNTRFREAGSQQRPEPLTPLVVVGEVASVTRGAGWTEAGDRVGFDDDAALFRHVDAVVAVDEVLGSAGWAAPTVRVGFPVGVDQPYDLARSQLENGGPWVLPLRRPHGLRDDPGLWVVGPANAVLLAEVGDAGRLSLPCVGPGVADRLLADVPTLSSLRSAAARPVRERVVRATSQG